MSIVKPDYLLEQLKAINNLCQIAIYLRENKKNRLLPSMIEVIFLEVTKIVEENCVING